MTCHLGGDTIFFQTAILAQEQIPLDRKSCALVTGNYRLLAAERLIWHLVTLLLGLESDTGRTTPLFVCQIDTHLSAAGKRFCGQNRDPQTGTICS